MGVSGDWEDDWGLTGIDTTGSVRKTPTGYRFYLAHPTGSVRSARSPLLLRRRVPEGINSSVEGEEGQFFFIQEGDMARAKATASKDPSVTQKAMRAKAKSSPQCDPVNPVGKSGVDWETFTVSNAELCLFLKIGETAVNRWWREGLFERETKTGGGYRFLQCVNAYIEKLRVKQVTGEEERRRLEMEQLVLKNEKLKLDLSSWRAKRDRRIVDAVLEQLAPWLGRLREALGDVDSREVREALDALEAAVPTVSVDLEVEDEPEIDS